MTPAVVLAALAGACAAAAAVDAAALAGAHAARRGARGERHGRRTSPVLAALGRRIGAAAHPRDLDARIAAAGLDGDGRAAELVALKAGAAGAAVVLGLPLAAAAPGRLGVVLLLACPPAAALLPDAWLRRRARRRASALARELPDVLEMLLVAVGAGLAPQRAAGEVGRRLGGVLPGELRRAAGRTALGMPWLEALDDLDRRCPCEGVPALVAALRRAHRHGTPAAPALAALAVDARARRAVAVREHATRAAPKIQLVVALLLVPAVLLLLGAAMVPALL